jgi:aryl-alcohol dehydrogenase-like predicted oxidoreductase
MKYRNLGRSGLKVSEVSLGSWMTFGGVVDDGGAVACIRRAYELGVNFFDTANVYNHGAAEEVLGRALEVFERSSLVSATKAFFPMGEGPNDRGNSRKHLFEQCEASLKRLGTDYVDLYQCHRYDPETPLEETLRALDDLQRQGKALYAGVSEWPAEKIREAGALARRLGLRPLISDQPGYSLLWRDSEGDVLKACADEGLGWVAFSPLAQGVLTGKYRPGAKPASGTRAADKRQNMWMKDSMKPEVLKRVQAMAALAKKLGLTPSQLALAWCLRLPVMASVITGATRAAQVEENVKASGVALPADALKRLEELFPLGGVG